jgi:hypothetical protein
MSKALAIAGDNQSIKGLLREAIEHHQRAEAVRSDVLKKQHEGVYEAWQTGIRLNKIKPKIARGNWLTWLEGNFCKATGIGPRMAEVYMKIDSDNPNSKRVSDLKFDSIRKYMLRGVPDKEKPLLKNNATFQRLVNRLKVANEFSKWKHRRKAGHIEANPEEERLDFSDMFEWLCELYGLPAPTGKYWPPDSQKEFHCAARACQTKLPSCCD